MAQQLYPVFGVTPTVFNDHSGTNDIFVPTVAELTNGGAAEALTYKGGSLQKAPAEGWRVTEIRLMNADISNACVVSMWVGTSTDALRFIGAINVPAKSGTDGTVVAVNGLSTTMFPSLPKDAAGNAYLEIGNGETLFLTAANADDCKSMVTIQTYAAPA